MQLHWAQLWCVGLCVAGCSLTGSTSTSEYGCVQCVGVQCVQVCSSVVRAIFREGAHVLEWLQCVWHHDHSRGRLVPVADQHCGNSSLYMVAVFSALEAGQLNPHQLLSVWMLNM